MNNRLEYAPPKEPKTLTVPEGKFASPDHDSELKISVEAFLETPKRLEHEESDIATALGKFLVTKGFIEGFGTLKDSWGFAYKDKKIYFPSLLMSEESYNKFIFRLGRQSETGEPLYPQEEETNQYRFLHETCHAYQDFLASEESIDNPGLWYDRAYKGAINSNFATLFNYCFKKRLENGGKGLSTWGNVLDYKSIANHYNQQTVRAIEDANEFIVMRLWNPEYLETFLEYLSGNIPGYGDRDLADDGLVRIKWFEKERLKKLIESYIEEMKNYIS